MVDATEPRVIESRFAVESDCAGWRLDRYLRHKIPRLSRTRIQRIIKLQLTIDGAPAKPSSKLRAGQGILIRRPAPREPPVPRDFRVLFDDGDVLAIDKPAGLPMHPTARYHFGTLTRLLSERFPGQPLQIAHRIDRETSGLVLIARGPVAARGLKMAFAARKVEKKYLALVHGQVRDGLGTIDLPLRLSEGPIKIKMVVDRAAGLPSRTRWRVVERLPAHTLLECRPETGRQHQIRAHLFAIGHPLVGDKLYCSDEQLFTDFCDRGWSDTLADRLVLPRQALHAFEVRFPHPRTGVWTTLTAPLAEDIAAYVRALREQ
ncbi:MAG TPA: RluA family pseudouridine synthase [Polyangia bacterium]|nr:RluA family pseudouridine synthase [Polyangia bacterium]